MLTMEKHENVGERRGSVLFDSEGESIVWKCSIERHSLTDL